MKSFSLIPGGQSADPLVAPATVEVEAIASRPLDGAAPEEQPTNEANKAITTARTVAFLFTTIEPRSGSDAGFRVGAPGPAIGVRLSADVHESERAT